MMDEESKTKFKTTFYFLAVQLNIIILLIALAIMVFFIGPLQYRIPLIILLFIMVFGLSLHFRKKYYDTKAWLDEHADKGKDI